MDKKKLKGCRPVITCEQDLNQSKWQLGDIVKAIAGAHILKQNLLKRIPEIETELEYAKQQEAAIKAEEEAKKAKEAVPPEAYIPAPDIQANAS